MAAILFTAGSMLTGCDTAADKVDAAAENVEEAKEELEEAKQEEAVIIETIATEAEWKVFKKDSDEKIAKNNAKIVELKGKIRTSGKGMGKIYAERIEKIEKKNAELKERLDNFDNEQTDWDSFKREFDHDMGELGKAFSELGTDSSK
jgi:chromosome segregation ATPase